MIEITDKTGTPEEKQKPKSFEDGWSTIQINDTLLRRRDNGPHEEIWEFVDAQTKKLMLRQIFVGGNLTEEMDGNGNKSFPRSWSPKSGRSHSQMGEITIIRDNRWDGDRWTFSDSRTGRVLLEQVYRGEKLIDPRSGMEAEVTQIGIFQLGRTAIESRRRWDKETVRFVDTRTGNVFLERQYANGVLVQEANPDNSKKQRSSQWMRPINFLVKKYKSWTSRLGLGEEARKLRLQKQREEIAGTKRDEGFTLSSSARTPNPRDHQEERKSLLQSFGRSAVPTCRTETETPAQKTIRRSELNF